MDNNQESNPQRTINKKFPLSLLSLLGILGEFIARTPEIQNKDHNPGSQ
jgi:hypothetical protein